MTAARLLQLLAIFALLLMPLAMAGQSHAAATAPHHQMASAQEGHCAAPAGEEDTSRSGPSAECLMACAALPAAEAPVAIERIVPKPTLAARAPRTISGLSPEAETPPPRFA